MAEKQIHKMGFAVIANQFKVPRKLEHLVSQIFVDLDTSGKDFREPSRFHNRIASACQAEQTLMSWRQMQKIA